MLLLKPLMKYVDLIRAVVDNVHDNPRDDIEMANTCISPRVSHVNEDKSIFLSTISLME